MPSHQSQRTAEDIRREIIAILGDLKDPRVAGKMITVVRIAMASDNSYAKVYISALDGMESAAAAAKALNGAQGYIRREIGRSLHLRKAPELKFVADDSIEHGMKIIRELNDLTGEE